MKTANPLLQNLSSQVVFEAYARLTAEQAQLAAYDPSAFNDALKASVLRVLAERADHASETTTPSIS